MTTSKAKSLNHLLIDHGLDHILNSPDDDFLQFIADQEEVPDTFEKLYDSALNAAEAKACLPSANQKSALVVLPAGKSTLPANIREKRSLLNELMENAKALGLTIRLTMQDLDLMDEAALDLHIAEFMSAMGPDDYEALD